MERAAIEELQAQLCSLRPVLLAERGRLFLELFDEFMAQHEFELALHAVCDFLLEPNSPSINKSTIALIQRLHTIMELDDRCVEELHNRKSL